MLLKIMGIVALMCSSAFCFHYDKDCIAKDGWDTDGIRSSWDIRFWVSKGDTENVLTLVSENLQMSSLRKIDITRKQVDYFFGRKGLREQNSTSIAGEGLSPGWNEARVTSDERFRVWVTGMDDPLVDVEDEVRAESILIMGSNVTVNCGGSMTVWVATEDKEIFVPFGIVGRYHITMFSRTPFSPIMKLGHQIQLFSWDSTTSAVTTFATQLNPLPPFREHNFTVQCDNVGNHFKCTAVAGQNDTLVSSVYLLEEIESISFHSPGMVEFVVVLRHEKGDKMLDDVEIHNTLEERVMAGNDSNLQEINYQLYITLFINILINILLVVVTLALCFKNKKQKEIIRRSKLGLVDAKEANVRMKLYSIFCKPIVQSWKGERAMKTDNSNEEQSMNKDTDEKLLTDRYRDQK